MIELDKVHKKYKNIPNKYIKSTKLKLPHKRTKHQTDSDVGIRDQLLAAVVKWTCSHVHLAVDHGSKRG